MVFNLDSSDSSSDIEENTDYSSVRGDGDGSSSDSEYIEDQGVPEFDSSKEVDYKIKYKQSFEELVIIDDFVLYLDCHKM